MWRSIRFNFKTEKLEIFNRKQEAYQNKYAFTCKCCGKSIPPGGGLYFPEYPTDMNGTLVPSWSQCNSCIARDEALEAKAEGARAEETETRATEPKKSKSQIMKRAWEIAACAAMQFGGRKSEYFSQALKQAWKE